MFFTVPVCVLLTHALVHASSDVRSISKYDDDSQGDLSGYVASRYENSESYNKRPDSKERSYERIRIRLENDMPPAKRAVSDLSRTRRAEKHYSSTTRRESSIHSRDKSVPNPNETEAAGRGKTLVKGIRSKGTSVVGKLNEFRKTKKGKAIIGGGVAATAVTAVAGASALALGATALGVGGGLLADQYL